MSKIRQRNYDYDPVIFLRCHSKTDRDCADVHTQVWQACFEPSSKSKMVATCGGNQICLIDVKSQFIDQRYTTDSRENLYALTWGTLEHKNLEKPVTILVSGGLRRIIYFILPSRKVLLTQYNLKAQKAHISNLLFHPKDESILFCSTSGGEVIILKLHVDTEQMLVVEEINKIVCRSEIFASVYCKSLDMLLAATASGLIGWFLNDCEKEIMETDIIKFRLPTSNNIKNSEGFDFVDSVEIIKNNRIAVKCAEHGYIYICDLNVEMRNENSNVIDLAPSYFLHWSSTDNYYMSINVNYEKGLLTCGDDKGCIWLYDINEIKYNDLPTKREIDPCKKIEWPIVEDRFIAKTKKLNLDTYDIVVAKAAIHSKGKYIVAVTSNNTVCIWKLASGR